MSENRLGERRSDRAAGSRQQNATFSEGIDHKNPAAAIGRKINKPSPAVSSDSDPACRDLNADYGKTHCVAWRCSQTPPLATQLQLAFVGWALTTDFP